MANKPVIGIVAESMDDVSIYSKRVSSNNGLPWQIILEESSELERVILEADGLLFGGEIGPGLEAIDCSAYPEQLLTVRLLRLALESDLPVLCICSGMLYLNVALGGTVPSCFEKHGVLSEDGLAVSSYHRIYIAPGSKLAAIVGSGGFVRVNSRHQIALKEPQKSPLLLASAYSIEDGVIEALESPSNDWVIGVQFQPERRMELPPHFERLFQGLVERSEAKKPKRNQNTCRF